MAIIVVIQGPSLTQAQYEQATSRLTGGAKRRMETLDDWPVKGLLAHAAGQGPNGFRVVDVWASEEALQEFTAELMPIMQELGIDVIPEIYPALAFVTA